MNSEVDFELLLIREWFPSPSCWHKIGFARILIIYPETFFRLDRILDYFQVALVVKYLWWVLSRRGFLLLENRLMGCKAVKNTVCLPSFTSFPPALPP